MCVGGLKVSVLSVHKACLGGHITTPCLKCCGVGFRVNGMVDILSEKSSVAGQAALLQVLTQLAVHGAECGIFDVTGQNEEGDGADASKYEGAYARCSDEGVCKAARDYLHDAWDLSESSEEDGEEDKVPATADVEEEDDGFQVSRQSFL